MRLSSQERQCLRVLDMHRGQLLDIETKGLGLTRAMLDLLTEKGLVERRESGWSNSIVWKLLDAGRDALKGVGSA